MESYIQNLVFATRINGTEHTGIINSEDYSVFCHCTKENAEIILEALKSVKTEFGDRACPCHYLKEPCHPTCTCVNKYSSYGCKNCCTYGSLEQRQKMAEDLNFKVYPKPQPSDDEVKRILQNHSWKGNVNEKDYQNVIDRIQKLFTGKPLK
jgi:hypothetical protein